MVMPGLLSSVAGRPVGRLQYAIAGLAVALPSRWVAGIGFYSDFSSHPPLTVREETAR